MKNSQIKHHRHTVSNPFSNCNTINKCQSVQTNEFKSYNHIEDAYDSNYNYFVRRIGSNNHIEQNNQAKPTHQRYNSLGNSKVIIQSEQNPPQNKLSSGQCGPYLLQFNTKQNKNVQPKLKITTRNDPQSYTASPTNLIKHTMKLSMKNLHKNAFNTASNERQFITRESQVSTTNQTYQNSSQTSKIVQQKIMKDQLLKYFSVNMQKSLNSLKMQIQQQNAIITNMEVQINNLNTQLKKKELAITELKKISYSKRDIHSNKEDSSINPETEKHEFYLYNKINNLQNEINHLLKVKINQQAETQKKINIKIDKILQYLSVKNQTSRSKSVPTHLKDQLRNLSVNIRNFNDILNKFFKQSCFLKQIRLGCTNLKIKIQQVKNTIKQSVNNISLQQTAQFRFQQSKSNNGRDKYQKQQLNDSNSYFFHPSELGNIQKITQLFINRQGQPIKCYTDNFNQVKYKDTNTYMFNKKGDIVQLTDKQKRYYVDKGLIARNL